MKIIIEVAAGSQAERELNIRISQALSSERAGCLTDDRREVERLIARHEAGRLSALEKGWRLAFMVGAQAASGFEITEWEVGS